MSYHKKALALVLFIGLFCLLAGSVSATVVYKDGTARIQSGTNNLKDIKDTNYLEVKNGICYVKKPIVVASTGTLKVNTTSCSTVKMYATSLITIYGKIYFDGVKVTSYDPKTGKPIELSRTNYSTVRPDIVTRSSAQYFSAKNSEFSYLGYYNSSSSHWGVALRFLPKAYIDSSKFHHNYFGFYTFDSDNVTIQNSEVYDNLEYGIDIHDFSDNFVASNNVVYNNGNHGIILSKYNENGKIIGNKVYDHTQNAFVKGVVKTYGTHGIELHQESNNSEISGNELTNNRVGIKLANSHDNVVKNNKVNSDLEQGFYLTESHNNQIAGNQVVESTKEPLYSFNSFYNAYSLNSWGDADDILYVKIDDNGVITRYKFPAPGADEKLNSYSSPPDSSAQPLMINSVQSQDIATSKVAVNDLPTIVEDNHDDTEVDKVRDGKLGIKSNKVRTKAEEKAYVEKIKKYEKGLAQELTAEVKIKDKLAVDKTEIVMEDNHDDAEVDKVRDAKLGVKSKVRTREEERAYVDKIRKYEKDIADQEAGKKK